MSGRIDYRNQTVDMFSVVMKEKMMARMDKGPWGKCSNEYLFEAMRDEVVELITAINNNEPKIDVTKEAADIANYAMMIADNYKQRRK